MRRGGVGVQGLLGLAGHLSWCTQVLQRSGLSAEGDGREEGGTVKVVPTGMGGMHKGGGKAQMQLGGVSA